MPHQLERYLALQALLAPTALSRWTCYTSRLALSGRAIRFHYGDLLEELHEASPAAKNDALTARFQLRQIGVFCTGGGRGSHPVSNHAAG